MKHILSTLCLATLLSACGTELDMHEEHSGLEEAFMMVQEKQEVHCEKAKFFSAAKTGDFMLVCFDLEMVDTYACAEPWIPNIDGYSYFCGDDGDDDDDIVPPSMIPESVEAGPDSGQSVFCEKVRFTSDVDTHDHVLICLDPKTPQYHYCPSFWRSKEQHLYICSGGVKPPSKDPFMGAI